MKKIAAVLLAAGILLAALSVLLPFVDVRSAANQGMGIIGGADAPTYWLVYSQKYIWLTILAVIVSAGSAVLLRKK